MEEKYIELLLRRCVKSESKSLFLFYNSENKKFINKLKNRAEQLGYNDIILVEKDIFFELELLNNLSLDEIKKHPYFNNKNWDVYALKGASFLLASSPYPDVYERIESEKIQLINNLRAKEHKIYIKKAMNDEISWTVYPLPNECWAKSLFPNEKHPIERLKNLLYEFCFIDSNDPIENWNNYIKKENEKCELLNNLKIKKLHFQSSNGTNLTIGLVDNYIFRTLNEDRFLENIPTYSIWTMPHKYQVDGIVYGTYPISALNGVIKDYYFKFNRGRVVEYDAKYGKNLLDNIFENYESARYLGEIALVNFDNLISKTKKIYNANIIDENAVTHFALGNSYSNTIDGGQNMSDEEAEIHGCNRSDLHIDFMIGTDDMKITAVLEKDEIVNVFINGNFNEDLLTKKKIIS